MTNKKNVKVINFLYRAIALKNRIARHFTFTFSNLMLNSLYIKVIIMEARPSDRLTTLSV